MIQVLKEDEGKRLDSYLTKILTEYSRSHLQKMIAEGNILVNGKQEKTSYKVNEYDEIQILDIELKELDIKPENIDIEILYEDEYIIVVNKPKGLVVHPANGNESGTLVNAILYYSKDLSGINGTIRPGIVHRIDKDTSGLLVIAKNDEAHNGLSEQFKDHTINRTYIALVDGVILKDKLDINMPIGRDKVDRKKMAVSLNNGKRALTHITVLKRYENYTLIEAKLETGRTHQIRVHMSKIGHPLVGDNTYGKKKNEFGVAGQMLHAKTLGFMHPHTGEFIEFSSELPEYFNNILEILNIREEKT